MWNPNILNLPQESIVEHEDGSGALAKEDALIATPLIVGRAAIVAHHYYSPANSPSKKLHGMTGPSDRGRARQFSALQHFDPTAHLAVMGLGQQI